MRSNTNHLKNSNSQNQAPFSFEKGDVFFVRDSSVKGLAHPVIMAGQKITGHEYPSIVHVGVALDRVNTIEMTGEGIRHFKFSDIHGQDVKVFRFKDKKLREIAADLAYNMATSYLVQHVKDEDNVVLINTEKDAGYAYWKAFVSAFYNKADIELDQIKQLNRLINTFDFKKHHNKLLTIIYKTLGWDKPLYFCSEHVIKIFYMSYLILKNGVDFERKIDEKNGVNAPIGYIEPIEPMHCNLEKTCPSDLYDILKKNTENKNPGWYFFELQVLKENEKTILVEKKLEKKSPRNKLKIHGLNKRSANDEVRFSMANCLAAFFHHSSVGKRELGLNKKAAANDAVVNHDDSAKTLGS